MVENASHCSLLAVKYTQVNLKGSQDNITYVYLSQRTLWTVQHKAKKSELNKKTEIFRDEEDNENKETGKETEVKMSVVIKDRTREKEKSNVEWKRDRIMERKKRKMERCRIKKSKEMKEGEN